MNERHALAILGSPHTNGMTAAMLNCAIRSMDEFFKTAGMKTIGKIVCAGTGNKKELPERIIKKIEKCMK